MLRLKEPAMLLRCREIDRKVVESTLEDSKREYLDKTKRNAPTITIDKVYLPPPPKGSDHHGLSW